MECTQPQTEKVYGLMKRKIRTHFREEDMEIYTFFNPSRPITHPCVSDT